MDNQEPKQVIVERERKSSVGTIVAVVVGVLILIIAAMYVLPMLMGGGSTTNVDVTAPTPAPSAAPVE